MLLLVLLVVPRESWNGKEIATGQTLGDYIRATIGVLSTIPYQQAVSRVRPDSLWIAAPTAVESLLGTRFNLGVTHNLGYLFEGPYNKDYSICGSMLGFPYFESIISKPLPFRAVLYICSTHQARQGLTSASLSI